MQDKEIISLFFSRDQKALSEVSHKYGAYCYSLAFNIVSQHEDAEECVNDTWLGAWNSIPPKKPDILKYFLAKITRGKAIDRLKKYHAQKRGADEVAVVLEELSDCIEGGSNPEHVILIGELSEIINVFLATIPIRDRQLFVRRYFYTESINNIASKAGMSNNNVSVSLHRTRAKLKDHLKREGYLI